ncbi:hypothetical protein BE21_13540 [Sorangium cellulosum]|uniref:Uncharacterized protein n=1 Tax=Sorangium cellulosum TaxID=56 RepID=A0A150TZT3_SORCE|nr:hypothetical protein BE21_13540 [Sorangium cellulosum]
MRSFGFNVEDIPEAEVEGQKRADLLATYDDEEYIVEAKFRNPHHEWRELCQRAESDAFATTTRDIEPWATLSNVICKAHAQLISTPSSTGAFRMLWVVALHPDDNFVMACTKKALVGTRLLFAYNEADLTKNFGALPQARECYYFDDNDFERYPGIDAAMLCTFQGGQLFVNHFSPNLERFRRSHLYTTINEKGAVVDAEILTRSGRAFMLNNDFLGPRREGAQQIYLRETYGALVSVAVEKQLYGQALAPVSDVQTQIDSGLPSEETRGGGRDGG